MIEKGKISAFQMALMIIPTIIATAVLVVPGITGKYAGRDMWISPIYGAPIGFFTVFIVYQLHKYYPEKSIIQYSRHIIGRIPAKILGFVYLFFFLHTCGVINQQYAGFIISSFLPRTPMIVIMISVVLVCAFAVRGGVEVLGRVAQLFIPIFMLLPFLLILLFNDLEPKNMFPILEYGMLPSIRGSAVPMAWFSEVFLVSMLLPFVTDHEMGRRWGMISVFVAMLSFIIENIVSICLFGGSVAHYRYPAFSAFRYINVAAFFEHLEAFVIVIWVMGAFVKLAMFYYVLVLGTAQWLHLSDYRPLVFPFGLLVIVFSIWAFPNAAELAEFLGTIVPFYLPLVLTLLPTLLLLIEIIRKKWKYKLQTIKE